jgi:hypothetical protein
MLSWTGREEWIEIMIVRDQGKIAVTSLTMWDYLMRANQCCAGEARRIRVVAKSLRPQLQGELKVPTVTDRRQMWQAWFLLLKLDLPPPVRFQKDRCHVPALPEVTSHQGVGQRKARKRGLNVFRNNVMSDAGDKMAQIQTVFGGGEGMRN